MLAAVLAVALSLLGGTSTAVAGIPSLPDQHLYVAQPSSVCGYSQHALDQMHARAVTPLDVRTTVALGTNSAFVNNHGNWQYESSDLIVVLNDAGCVVTVMRR